MPDIRQQNHYIEPTILKQGVPQCWSCTCGLNFVRYDEVLRHAMRGDLRIPFEQQHGCTRWVSRTGITFYLTEASWSYNF